MSKICPICGYRNKDFVEFCEKCLFPIDEGIQEAEEGIGAEAEEGLEESGLGIYCPNGHWNPPDAKFCQICGVPLQGGVEALEEEVDKGEGYLEEVPLESSVASQKEEEPPAGLEIEDIFGMTRLVEQPTTSTYGTSREETEEIRSETKIFRLASITTNFQVELVMEKGKVVEFLIGRRSGKHVPDIDLSELEGGNAVSRKHALIILDGVQEKIFIKDLKSTNGTYLNGMRLEPEQVVEIHPGDILSFGRKLKFTLEE